MRFVAVMATLAGEAVAQEWEPIVDDKAIFEALADRTVTFDAYTFQTFGAAGETRFVTERAADGVWVARDSQYCSQWPPSALWDCYDIEVRGEEIKFIGPNRAESIGTFGN